MASVYRFGACSLLLGLPLAALAHSFAAPYTLPVPFAMYAYGACAALVLSFLVVGVFARVPDALTAPATSARTWRVQPLALALVRGLAVALLILCIATGLFGTSNPFVNFSMTFFWIVFTLGFAYGTALCGDLYGECNPWRVLCAHVLPATTAPPLRYPAATLGYYPALVLYMAFIWLELFGNTTPRSLALALVAYTVVNLAGAALFGIAAWFQYGEFFGVFLRLIAMMAPVRWLHGDDGSVRLAWRAPFTGLLEQRADHASLAVFVLFMLASTAFDGIHETQPWSTLFWSSMYPAVAPLVLAHSTQPYVLAARIFHHWQSLALVLSPWIYFGVYLACLQLTRLVTGTRERLAALALRFAYALVPIAFVYHVTHYYTLLLAQGPAFFKQLSDPFGAGWNLFGTAGYAAAPLLVDASTIWHTQVGLILGGHVISVWLAHMAALNIFGTAYRATVSQTPMLLLMVGLTAAGLWILSLPIASGQIAVPASTALYQRSTPCIYPGNCGLS